MKPLLLLAASLLIHIAYAQVKDKTYTYDQNWNLVKPHKAVYFLQVHKTNENNFVRTYYNMYGPRICQESFADEAGKVRNGRCSWYYTNGSLDSTGEYTDDIPSGAWYFYNEEGRLINYKYYEEGSLTDDIVILQHEKEVPAKEAVQTRQDEIEASFRGDRSSWVNFLLNHLRYPKRAVIAHITGTVQLQFLVDESGKIQEPEIKKSVEYSLDEEALRIIQLSPPWIAATKEGASVKSFKLQPLTFALTEK